jgi:MFS family permease
VPYRAPQTVSSPAETPTNIRYWVLGGFCIAAAIAYIQRYSINLLAPSIRETVQLDEAQMGRIMGSFFLGYGVMQIPAGWLGDRWGSRKALTLYALTWSSATALMALAWDETSLLCIWTLMGAAQAGIFPCAMIGVRDWLPATRRAVASGMLSTFMNVGAVLSPLLAGLLIVYYAWPDVFMWLALPGIAWAAWYFWWYRDRPADHAAVNAAERMLISGATVGLSNSAAQQTTTGQSIGHVKPRTPWLRLATSGRMWLIGAQQFFRAAAQVFFGTWFGTFLKESPGISAGDVAILASVPPALLIAGSMIGGALSDWLLFRTGSRRISRQGLAIVNLCLCAAMFAAAAVADNSHLRVALIAAACLFMTIGGVSAYTITLDVGGQHVATVFSTMNMCGSIGAAMFPYYAGWLVKTTGDWNDVLWSIVAIYIAAAACWALLNPNGTLFEDSAEPS